jgi:RNA polymerase sigma-70 factor (ECF subfamily)
LLRDAHDADDATQIALCEILKAASGFRGDGALEGWADRIAVRTILRIARERRVRSLRFDAVEPDALADPSGATRSLRDELPRELRAYLDELPETRRTTLVLRHALGYSVQEVAELTGVSPNTVKDRLLAAREQVRRLIRRDAVVGRSGA